MRDSVASAEVGDEAALFVPTGSMGNQIAVRLHTQGGQEVICEARAHILDWEMGMVAAYSGCQLRTVRGNRNWPAQSNPARCGL
jgi:threonine aldolase